MKKALVTATNAEYEPNETRYVFKIAYRGGAFREVGACSEGSSKDFETGKIETYDAEGAAGDAYGIPCTSTKRRLRRQKKGRLKGCHKIYGGGCSPSRRASRW